MKFLCGRILGFASRSIESDAQIEHIPIKDQIDSIKNSPLFSGLQNSCRRNHC